MRSAVWVSVAVVLAGCWHGAHRSKESARSPFGAVTVLARDHDSGEVVQNADLVLRGPEKRTATSSKYGFATFDKLPPGTYDLVATFAAQPVEIDGVDVHANQTAYLDVGFTLGRPDPVKVKYAATLHAEIDRYRPKDINPTVGRIEGTVTDEITHTRVAGAVVTAVGPHQTTGALQVVTDDQGRFRIDDVGPDTYLVSATYSLGGRGQIEVRRSDIAVAAGDAVVVPLVVEVDR